jgi:DNA-binding MarR family transcriptional regulator
MEWIVDCLRFIGLTVSWRKAGRPQERVKQACRKIGIGIKLNALSMSACGVLAAAQERAQLLALRLAQFDPVSYIPRCPRRLRAQQMNQMPDVCLPACQPGFTQKQGQYLAFIHAYTRVLGRPPAEADLQRHYRITPPSVHQMVLTLERAGLIRRQPCRARSIEVLVPQRRRQLRRVWNVDPMTGARQSPPAQESLSSRTFRGSP